MSTILPFHRAHALPVTVEDVSNRAVVATIVDGVRRLFRHIIGEWTVRVQRSKTERGRWRVELRGATGRHIWSVVATVARLPEIVLQKLELFLQRSAAAWRAAFDAGLTTR
jgi:hypothetical protein